MDEGGNGEWEPLPGLRVFTEEGEEGDDEHGLHLLAKTKVRLATQQCQWAWTESLR